MNLHIITNGFEQTQFQKLKNAGIDIYFSQVITSEAAMALKPKKEIYEYAQKITGSTPSDSVMIGDSAEADILGAINANWKSIYYNPAQKQTSIKATYEIQHLKQIINILN